MITVSDMAALDETVGAALAELERHDVPAPDVLFLLATGFLTAEERTATGALIRSIPGRLRDRFGTRD